MQNRHHATGLRGGVAHRSATTPGSGEPVEASRGSAVVCVLTINGADELLADGLASVVEHTPSEVPIVLCAEIGAAVGAGRREIIRLPGSEDGSFARSANAALAAAHPADVALVASGTIVGSGWLERLRDAAHSDSHVASASALSNVGSLLRVGAADVSSAAGLEVAAASVAAHSLLLRPRLPSAALPCVYLRRNAIDLAGDFDESLTGAEGALVDFSQRCVLRGLLHVAADDVLVWSAPPRTRRGRRAGRDAGATEDATALARRYPYYERERQDAERSVDRPVHVATRRALHALRRPSSDGRLSVTIDGRVLTAVLAGTQIDTLETIRALAATGEVVLSVVVPPDLGRHARAVLSEADVPLLKDAADLDRAGVADIVFRPYQVSRVDDLSFLRPLGNRLVLSCLDLIAYHNPGYFPVFPQWQRYQASVRIALGLADHVVFISHDCAEEAISERIVERERASVVYLGVDHASPRVAARRPDGLERLGELPFLLCLGADYRHKNRVFALELLAALRDEHGWNGALVLAGPHLTYGSSADEEAVLLDASPDLEEHVMRLGQVSEAEKRWLIERSIAVCYPTTREGFGFIPFEAAALGRPCIFASTTALGELLPSELMTIVQWSPQESAPQVLALLTDADRVAEHVAAINARARELTWQRSADQLLGVFEAVRAAQPRDGGRIVDDLRDIAADGSEAERKYTELWSALSEAGRELVGPGGVLSQPDQSALLAVARGPLLHRLLLGQVRVLRRLQRHAPKPAEEPATEREAFQLHFAPDNERHMSDQLAPIADLEELD